MSLFTELKRRNVFRVATAYIVAGWIIMQVIDVMSPALKLPEWVASLFAVVLLIGFPIALVISWVYEVTEDGLRRTEAIDDASSIAAQTGRRLDGLIIGGLVIVGALIVWQMTSQGGVGRGVTTDGSIAVLPFVDLSADRDQEYFADGISEEILNVLAGVEQLKVAGRTSSFSFKGKDQDLRKIGDLLGVANILEGSVRKQGNRIRVTAQLIKADDGFHLWSETFDAELDDIFEVQDRIASDILAALREHLIDDALEAPATTVRTEVGVYQRYLEAKQLIYTRKVAEMRRASALLDDAIAADPGYAPAYAARALVENLLSDGSGSYGDIPIAEAMPRAIDWAETALELDPGLADAHAVRGLLYLNNKDAERAALSLRRAVEINPSHLDARNWLALSLGASGRYNESAEQTLALFEFDPLYPPVTNNVVSRLLTIGDKARAELALERMRKFDTSPDLYQWAKASFLASTGDIAAGIELGEPVFRKFPTTGRSAGLAYAWLFIGETDKARSFGFEFIEPFLRVADGDIPGALAKAEELLAGSPDYFQSQIDYITLLSLARENQQLADYYQDTFDDSASFERQLFGPYGGQPQPFGEVAYALRETGDRAGFDEMMQRWRTSISIARAGGADSYGVNASEALWYALSGDTDEAARYLGIASEQAGGVLGYDFVNTILAEELGGNAAFEALMATNLRRINEERRKLGLESIAF